ncbi:hypothetical protein T459_17665, partial [Capsicum annuum]
RDGAWHAHIKHCCSGGSFAPNASYYGLAYYEIPHYADDVDMRNRIAFASFHALLQPVWMVVCHGFIMYRFFVWFDGMVRYGNRVNHFILERRLVLSASHIQKAPMLKINVATVSDGLKARELLKGRPHNIDLILTEVDLPSISGYALLTLIMEHDICKNMILPFSSYHCRRSWQAEVPRGGLLMKVLHNQRLRPQLKTMLAATVQVVIRLAFRETGNALRKEVMLSSCTKPELENEEENAEDLPESTQPNRNASLPNAAELEKELLYEASNRLRMSKNDARAPIKDANAMVRGEDINSDDNWGHGRTIGQTSDENPGPPTKQAIDLIGAFDNYLKCNFKSSDSDTRINKADSSPLLDLSLTRSHPSGSVNQFTNEKRRLNHSDASAFTR